MAADTLPCLIPAHCLVMLSGISSPSNQKATAADGFIIGTSNYFHCHCNSSEMYGTLQWWADSPYASCFISLLSSPINKVSMEGVWRQRANREMERDDPSLANPTVTASFVHNPWALIFRREHNFIPGLTLWGTESIWCRSCSPSVIMVAADSSVAATLLLPALGCTQSAVKHVCFHTTLLKPCELGKLDTMLCGLFFFFIQG